MEPLNDPCQDRQVKSVKPPPHKPLPTHLLYPEKLKNKPDWKLVRDHLSKEGKLAKADFIRLIKDMNKVFKNEGNMLTIQDPVTVVGDIHGQFFDLLKILEIGGNPDNTKYLFLGDFVDRGSFSIEVLILLYAIKLNHPNTILFIRGNHECRQMTSFFNFRDECLYKYDQEIYDLLMDSFDLIPVSCLVNGKFLACHGGISPELRTLDDIKKIDRFKEPPKAGIFCDLLWADPVEADDGHCDNVYKNNEVRGCSFFFGADAINKFLTVNNLLTVIHAHEAQIEGYKMHRWNGANEFPAVITIFSAANYCDVYNNKGAVIKFENNTLNIQQYNSVQHPYLLPNFMDIFSWSLPFVSEKVNEILTNLIKKEDVEDNLDSDEEKKLSEIMEHGGQKERIISLEKQKRLKSKIRFISKMAKMQKALRENHESIVKLKGVCPDNKIPKGLLLENAKLKNVLDKFGNAKKADSVNEKRPGDNV